jgi:hypothetical protein
MGDRSIISARKTKFEVLLGPAEVEMLHEYRGDLSPEAFIAALIRILESGAVSDIPPWARRANLPPSDGKLD